MIFLEELISDYPDFVIFFSSFELKFRDFFSWVNIFSAAHELVVLFLNSIPFTIVVVVVFYSPNVFVQASEFLHLFGECDL